MAIKLIKACKDLNIGMSTAVEFFKNIGQEIPSDPNARLDDEQYLLLAKQFNKAMALKIEAERQARERQQIIDSNNKKNDTIQTNYFSWSDDQIIQFLKQHWGCDEFVFDCKISEKPIFTQTPDKYKGSISSIMYNGTVLSYPGSTKPIFLNIPSQISHEIPTGKCKLRFKLLKREAREKSNNMFLITPDYNSWRELNVVKARKMQQQKAEEGKIDYSDKEKDLFERWGVRDCKFIGRYSYDAESGVSIVDDLRKPNFAKMSYYPNDETKSPIEIKFPFPIPDIDGTLLPSDEYYLFNWKFSERNYRNPYEIHIDFNIPPQRIRPHWFIDQLFYDRYNDVSKNFDTATNFLDTLSKQLSAKESTFIYELLQNANDYPKDNLPIDVEFHITDNYLIFMHSGAEFNVRNISGICGVNEKEKTANKKTIGYKGIGFKTVFHQNHYVYIQTGEYSFRFEEKASIIKRQEAPWPILPIWTSQKHIPKEISKVFDSADSKFRVKIALRPDDSSILHSGRLNYEKLFSEVFEDSNIILFTKNIRSVRVYIDGRLERDCTINENKWLVANYEAEIDPKIQAFINKDIESGKSKIPEKYKDFDITKISFACKKEGRILRPIENSTLYCYLPTSVKLGFPFLLNTDMIPVGDRDRIENEVYLKDENETNFNFYLAKLAGIKFFKWIQDLIQSGEYDYDSIFQLIPNFDACSSEYEDIVSNFREGFESQLEIEPLVPIVSDKEIIYKPVNEIIFDTIGISCSGVMTDEQILEFCAWSDYFPHPTLRDFSNAQLKPGINLFLEKYRHDDQVFEVDYVVSHIEDSDFQEWLKKESNNTAFIKYIIKKELLDNFSDSSMFIATNGELYKPNELYYELEKYYDGINYFEDYLERLSTDTIKTFKGDEVWDEFVTTYFVEFDPDKFVDNILLDSNNFDNVHDILMDSQNSLKFMQFLSHYVGYSKDYLKFPFVDENGVMVENFSACDFIYLPCADAVNVREYPWVDSDLIAVVSSKYDDKSFTYIKNNFTVSEFTIQSFIEGYICRGDYKDTINDYIGVLENSLHFIEFLYQNKQFVNDGTLKQYSIGCVSKSGDEYFLDTNKYWVYLIDPKENFSYLSLSWLDTDMFDIVREEYFNNKDKEDFTKFLEKKFGISTLNFEKYVSEVLVNNVDKINKYLLDDDINKLFWKWTKEHLPLDAKVNSIFTKYYILAKSLEDDEFGCYNLDEYNIFLSSSYQTSDDVEKIVSRYVPDTLFVASYMERETKSEIKDWIDFWGKIGVKITIADLIINNVIPNVDEILEDGLPNLLGQYYSEIQENWEEVKSFLAPLKVKTNDGEFTPISDVVLVDVAKEKEPFAEIVIPNQVKSSIIGNRNTEKLLLDIAREAGTTVIRNITEWQEYKINAYISNEEEYDEAVHFSFIDELSKIDVETIKSFDNIANLRLIDDQDEYLSPSELTFGSSFEPECDFEKFNIDFKYVSNKYVVSGVADSLKFLVNRGILDVHYKFDSDDIQELSSYDFALYFWQEYVWLHQSEVNQWMEENLFDDQICVPTMEGTMEIPNNLYARSISEYVVKKIKNWESKFPSDKIPKAQAGDLDLFDKLPFMSQLSIVDSLDALLNIKSKEKRATILEWMYSDYTDEDAYMISEYRNNADSLWKNGKGIDVSLDKLYALSPKSKRLHLFFRDNENIIHGDYLPRYFFEDKYIGVCDMMQIPIIEEDDMEFTPLNKHEEHLAKYFEGRLLLVAAIEEPNEWKKLFEKYKEKINELSFWNCSKIAWVYSKNEAIQQSNKRFFYQDDQFYFVDSWCSRLVYGYFIDTIRDYIKSDLDEDQFRRIMDPDSMIEELLEAYYNINTAEFIIELSKYDTEYKPDIVYENADEDDEEPSYTPKVVVHKAKQEVEEQEEDISSVEDDDSVIDEIEELEINKDTSKFENTIQNVVKDSIVVADPGEEVVSSHYRSGTWVEPYYREDGTYVSGYYRSDSIVSEHTREASDYSSQRSCDGENGSIVDEKEDVTTRNQQNHSTSTRTPRNSNWKREPHNFSKEQMNNMRSYGSPLELTTLPPTDEEVEILGKHGISVEKIADSNYIAKLRLYRNLCERGDEPTETLDEFLNNSADVAKHKLRGGKYVHACSAARGVMYISPSVWNKVMEQACIVCVYYGPHANQFFYIDTPEDFMKLVEKDDVVIKITGSEKVNVVGALYNGLLRDVKGTAYTLIRVAAHTEMDAVFARYVGAMKDDNEDTYNLDEF